ncbi:hypothetical protein E1262_08325 [Jiangella aurantiaca]|uniref:Uncharacterized protein n=1 Tax=Jiangella aurantiaca TaxID=2530373 RepID=A0A4V2YSS4_9ACTN|nr:hypothetical protein [Jiangella aurantiaca]TDD70657.1 hypothetical protein E1262_08325 [Jiangella aurantiaca]
MKLPESRPAIFISLPRNERRLAEQARQAGADGLKVHINVRHRASGTTFGSLADERSRLEEILAVGLPTGLVTGAGGTVSADETVAATAMGFDYFDVYADDAPPDYVRACGAVTPMVALGPGDGKEQARALVERGVRALELSTLEPERYRSRLSLATLARLESVTAAVDVPVVVPSQHALVPSDVALLADAGAAAVLLGAVVVGDDLDDFARRIAPFVASARGHG